MIRQNRHVKRVSTLITSTIALVSTMFVQSNAALAATRYPMEHKQIQINNQMFSTPMALLANQTTYMPLWYVMQALNQLGVQSQWNGMSWKMTLPTGMAVNKTLAPITQGQGVSEKKIFVNGTLTASVRSIVYTDPVSKVATTYIPIWYVMKAIGYANVNSTWDGVTWNIKYVKPMESTESNPAPQNQSGISPLTTTPGNAQESWLNNGLEITMNRMSYVNGSNIIPVEGKVKGNARGDLAVFVSERSNEWVYSIPVQSDGSFSCDITLPYSGSVDVEIGVPQTANGNFGLSQNAVDEAFTNNQPSLSESQMALLQSWMVNYNENGEFRALANQITANDGTQYSKIKDISNWVSANIDYNFADVNQNISEWHQATDTMNLRNGVCQDEASVAAAMLRSMGIPTEVVVGEAYDPSTGEDLGGHAWNRSVDGGRWFYFDPTWDQVYTQQSFIAPPQSVDDSYFDVNQTMFLQSHKPDSTEAYAWKYIRA